VEPQWGRICEGESGISNIEHFDASEFAVRIAGEIKNWDPTRWIEKRDVKKNDPFAQYAIAASDAAIADSGMDLDKVDRNRFGVILGAGIGGFQTFEEQHSRLLEKGPGKASPFYVPKLMLNAAPGQISIRHGLGGPSYACASACAASNNAIGTALRMLQYGDADMIMTGGSEAAIVPSSMAGFIALRALSKRNDEPTRASRPFDAERDGFVMGEGCGLLLFEELEHAQARGAKIYAEVAGYGATGDAFHITAPHETGDGAMRSMQAAIADAGLNPDDVDYVNAHGTSTELNDKIETLALHRTFGDHAAKLAISSTKSMIGHLLGASGGAELVVTALAVQNQVAPPTANLENPDPNCDLDYVPLKARDQKIRVAISNSFGFGGHNATILLKQL
jgi:3-oxoacyl-[acyl-carrier-protein] synthase II